MEDLSTHPLQVAGALVLLKVTEDPSALPADRSADHLPEGAASLAQIVMGAAAHSGAVETAARGVLPVVASPLAVRLEASPAVALAEAAASLVAMGVGAAEVVDKSMYFFMTGSSPSNHENTLGFWAWVTKP